MPPVVPSHAEGVQIFQQECTQLKGWLFWAIYLTFVSAGFFPQVT